MGKAIYVEEKAAEAAIEARRKYIEAINALGSDLQKENIILTNEILTNFMSGGDEYLAGLLVSEAVGQYNKAGIQVNSLMMQGLQQNSRAVASGFNKHVMPITIASQGTGIGPDGVTLEEGKAVFTKADEKQIMKEHTSFLKKEDEPLFERLRHFVASINAMDSELNAELGAPLSDCLRLAYTEAGRVTDANMQLRLRDDIPFVLDQDGNLEVNVAWFGAR